MATFTWVGGSSGNTATDSDPSVAANWTESGAPSATGTDDLVFKGTASHACLFDSNFECNSIKIESDCAEGRAFTIDDSTVLLKANTNALVVQKEKCINATGSAPTLRFSGHNGTSTKYIYFNNTTNMQTEPLGMFSNESSRSAVMFAFMPVSACTILMEDGVYPTVVISSLAAGNAQVMLSPTYCASGTTNTYGFVDILSFSTNCRVEPKTHTENDLSKKFAFEGTIEFTTVTSPTATITANRNKITANWGFATVKFTPTSTGFYLPVTGDVNFGNAKYFSAKYFNIEIGKASNSTYRVLMRNNVTLYCNSLKIDSGAKLYAEGLFSDINCTEIHTVQRPNILGDWNFVQVADGIYRSRGSPARIPVTSGGTGLDRVSDLGLLYGDAQGSLEVLDFPTSSPAGKVLAINSSGDGFEWSATAGGGGNAFDSIAVSGQTSLAASAGDDLTLVAAGGMTITTDATNDTITFSSADTNTTTTSDVLSALSGDLGGDFTIGNQSSDRATFTGGVTSLDLKTPTITTASGALSIDAAGDSNITIAGAGDTRVTIGHGTISPAGNTGRLNIIHDQSSSASGPALQIVTKDSDANSGPNINMYRDSANPADNDALGKITFQGLHDGSVSGSQGIHSYATIVAIATDVTENDEDGAIKFTASAAGSGASEVFRMGATNQSFNHLDIKSGSEVRFFDSDNSNKIGVKASAGLGVDYTLTLPTTDGDANQVLKTDGNGVLSWVAQTTDTNDDVSVANLKTRLAGGFGNNAVQIGDSNDVVTIPGSLVVTGTTTTNNVETVSTSNGVVFESNASANHLGDGVDHTDKETLLTGVTGLTSDITITLPSTSGTLARTADNISGTAAGLSSTLAIASGGTGATNSNGWLNSRITTNADGSLNYDATGATAVNHDSLAGFVAAEHYRWDNDISSTATIHANNIPTLNQSTTGNAATATTATNVVLTDNESTDEDNAIVFGAGADVDGSTSIGLESDGNLTYNPSSGQVSTGMLQLTSTTSDQLKVNYDGDDKFALHVGTDRSKWKMADTGGTMKDVISIQEDGTNIPRVGIHKSSPTAPLEVGGAIKSTSFVCSGQIQGTTLTGSTAVAKGGAKLTATTGFEPSAAAPSSFDCVKPNNINVYASGRENIGGAWNNGSEVVIGQFNYGDNVSLETFLSAKVHVTIQIDGNQTAGHSANYLATYETMCHIKNSTTVNQTEYASLGDTAQFPIQWKTLTAADGNDYLALVVTNNTGANVTSTEVGNGAVQIRSNWNLIAMDSLVA